MDSQVAARKSEKGKQAILDLHSHGLDFNQIVKRGIDSELLRTLYIQFGITDMAVLPSYPSQIAHDGNENESSSALVHKGNQADGPRMKSITGQSPLSTPLGESNSETVSSIKETAHVDTKNTSLNAATDQRSKTPSALPLKSSGMKMVDPKVLDRKDYIARMLAARSGKTATITNAAIQSTTSTNKKPKIIAGPTPSNATIKLVPPAAAVVTPPRGGPARKELSNLSPQIQKDTVDAEAKRRAQTDLARQKIEALKLQQETRKTINTLQKNQDEETTSSSAGPPEPISITETVARPTVLSRQSSYFSPVSQKAPFSIPGLFMASEPLEQTKKPDENTTGFSAASSPKLQEIASTLEDSHSSPTITTLNNNQENMIRTNNEAQINQSNVSSTARRKRQKAADFLDSPSTRVKRPLGQQEDCSVIIDVSDDEMANQSDIGSVDAEAKSSWMHASNSPYPSDVAHDEQHLTQSLPSLSNIPSNKTGPIGTLLAPSASNQTEGLRTKEMEIERMNRKIAMLEQRINAKKTSSRAHTPGTSGSAAISPPPGQPFQDGEVDSSNMKIDLNGETTHTSPDQMSLVALETADNIATEQELIDTETAKAEAERSLAEDIVQASIEERVQQDKSQTAEAFEKPTPTEDIQQSQDLETDEFNRQQTDSSKLAQDRNEETGQEDEEIKMQEQGEQYSHKVENRGSQVNEEQVDPDEQRQLRRLAIESGLPILDATMEKTKEKLDALRKEIDTLELEVRKGVEGRKALVEELESLSRTEKAYEAPDQHDPLLTEPNGGQSEPFRARDTQSKWLVRKPPCNLHIATKRLTE